MIRDFGEVLTAMVTPFDQDLNVDYKKVKELAAYLVDNGSDGLVVLGTTGEVPNLTVDEKVKILETVIAEVGDRAVIIAGTGSYSTRESIKMTRLVEEIGVDGAMVVVPYYNKPPQEGLYQHFKEVANSTSLPLMIYNVPGRTSRNIEVKTVARLAAIDNIVAIKEASGDLGQVAELSRSLGDDFLIYSGDDNLTLPVLSVGGHGVVSVASHLVGKEIKEMIRAFKKGQLNYAVQLNNKLTSIFNGIFITTNPIPVKAALNMIGINVGGLRLPLLEVNDAEQEKLRGILLELNLV